MSLHMYPRVSIFMYVALSGSGLAAGFQCTALASSRTPCSIHLLTPNQPRQQRKTAAQRCCCSRCHLSGRTNGVQRGGWEKTMAWDEKYDGFSQIIKLNTAN